MREILSIRVKILKIHKDGTIDVERKFTSKESGWHVDKAIERMMLRSDFFQKPSKVKGTKKRSNEMALKMVIRLAEKMK